MKRILLGISLLATLSFAGCSADKEAFPAGEGYGFADLKCSASAEVMTRAEYGLTFYVPAAEELKLTITGTDYEQVFEPFSSYEPNENRLVAGDYAAKAEWGDTATEGENCPAYYGETTFTIIPQKVISASIVAKLTKGVVKVDFTDQFLSYFHGEQVTLKTAAGNEFTFDSTTEEQAVFVCPGEINLSGSALKQTETEVTFTKAQTVAAQTLYTIKFDLANAGTATVIEISYNDTVIEEIEVGDIQLNPEL